MPQPDEHSVDEGLRILRRDARMAHLLTQVDLRIPQTHDDIYFVLLKSIVEQQLSLKAAATIWKRILAFMDAYPKPELLLSKTTEELRSVGLSYQKAGYLHNIARFALEEDVSFDYLQSLDDQEVMQHLTTIKGVGKWTAEMILMFSLGRTDIFPIDDLVVRNAMADLYGVKTEKRQLIKDLEAIAEAWRPYRSYACYLLWDWKDQA